MYSILVVLSDLLFWMNQVGGGFRGGQGHCSTDIHRVKWLNGRHYLIVLTISVTNIPL